MKQIERDINEFSIKFKVSDYKSCDDLMGRYRVLSTIGEGGQAIVKEGVDEETGESVALKIFKKRNMNFFGLNAAHFEYSVMDSLLDHDNILKTKCYFEDCDYIIIA